MSIKEGFFHNRLNYERFISIFKSEKNDHSTKSRPITTIPLISFIYFLPHKKFIHFIRNFEKK